VNDGTLIQVLGRFCHEEEDYYQCDCHDENQVRTSVAFSPCGEKIAAVGHPLGRSGHNLALTVWNLSDGTTKRHRHFGVFVRFAPNGNMLSADHSCIRIWNHEATIIKEIIIKRGHLAEKGQKQLLASLVLSPDGKFAATSYSGSGGVNLWNISNGQHVGSYEGGRAVAFLPGQRTFVTNYISKIRLKRF
jgi:WD40 repeat protein